MYPSLSQSPKKISYSRSFERLLSESYAARVFLLIAGFSAIRMVLAAKLDLGNDEAYYWFYTQQLQWNYFDHPPMIALFARMFTLNGLLDHHELFVRLSSIASCAISSWAIFKAVSFFHSERAGWYAAVLFNTSFYAGVVSGLFIMPDSPQMIFWTTGLWMLARICADDKKWGSWILFGIAAGLCIMSKVHGAFLWIGTLLYILVKRRSWLRYSQLYVAGLITVVIMSPILIWNIQHDFVTYRFHSQRVTITGVVNFRSFLEEFFGQIFFNNPVNVLLAVLSVQSVRKLRSSSFLTITVFIGVPLIIILLFVSLFRPVFPHWSGPGYVSLIPLSAVYLAEMGRRKWLRWSWVAAAIFLIGWPMLIHFYPGTWGSKKEHDLGKGDVTLDRFGWKEAGKTFAAYYRNELRSGKISSNTPLVCNTWWGAHVEYYFAKPSGMNMLGLGDLQHAHHYLWTNRSRKENADLRQAFAIVPSDEYYDAVKHYSAYYDIVSLATTIAIDRSGIPARKFYVYRMNGWKGNLPEIK
jgi:hypothetical protein